MRAKLYFSRRLRVPPQKNSLLYVTVGYKMLPFTHLLSFLHTFTTSFLLWTFIYCDSNQSEEKQHFWSFFVVVSM